MKTLYLECNMGAAGDMLMAALLELHPNRDDFLSRLNALGIPGVEVRAEPSSKCGIVGTHISVTVHGAEEESEDVGTGAADHDHDHNHAPERGRIRISARAPGRVHRHTHSAHSHSHDHGHSHDHPHSHDHEHSGIADIEALLGRLPISAKVRKDALAVYALIADAESHAHGKPVSEIHFHEVGNMDAVADIIGVCMLMDELAPDKVTASPVHVGSGNVRCAHGILPVPAPATAHILRGVPTYGGAVRGELCTPTGAALLKRFAQGFASMPVMAASAIGYGMGKKDFEAANCVRAILGETAQEGGEVAELSCNLDDMTPEAIAFAQQILLEEGALDVYTISIGMKKSRQGALLTCMCKKEDAPAMAALLLRHTTTLGVRESISRRYMLTREMTAVETCYGSVRVKTAFGYGVRRSKAEFDDLARIAKEKGLSLEDVRVAVLEAMTKGEKGE